MQKLTAKQKTFVQAFVRSGANAAAAARAAFDVSKHKASSVGWVERHKPHVAAAIVEETQRFLSTVTPKAVHALVGIMERDDLPPNVRLSAIDKALKYAPQFGAVITHNDPSAERMAEGLSKLAQIQAAAEKRIEAQRLQDQRNGNNAQVIEHMPIAEQTAHATHDNPDALNDDASDEHQKQALLDGSSSNGDRSLVPALAEEERAKTVPIRKPNRTFENLRGHKPA